jgi:hypothetical protein
MAVGRVHLMVRPTAATTGYAARRLPEEGFLGVQHSVPSLASVSVALPRTKRSLSSATTIMPALPQRRNARAT